MKKLKLICIEGQDRCGKDYTLDNITIPNLQVYKQYNDPPSYRENPNEFQKWLNTFLVNQANDLISLNKNIIMARLFSSEYVYSTLFRGKETTIHDIYKMLNEHFDIYQIILLFKDYNEYLDRLKEINEPIEYEESEFNNVISLYESSPFNTICKTEIFRSSTRDMKKIQTLVQNWLNE